MIRASFSVDFQQRAQVLLRRLFLCAAACALAWPGHANADVGLTFEGLDAFDGGATAPEVRGLSADGQTIFGRARRNNQNEVFYWKEGVLTLCPDLPGGSYATNPRGINADGTVVVGTGKSSTGDEVVLWTEGVAASLGVPAGWDNAFGYYASADASIIYGTATKGSPVETLPFRWTQLDGFTILTMPVDTAYNGMVAAAADGSALLVTVKLTTDGNKVTPALLKADGSTALMAIPSGYTGVTSTLGYSSNGLVVVGELVSTSGKENRAFKWTEANGVEILPLAAVAPGVLQTSKAIRVNTDGTFILGSVGSNAARWSTGLPEILGSFTPQAISADGSIVVGRRTTVGRQDLVIYDPVNAQVRSLTDLFVRQFGGLEIARWQSLSISYLGVVSGTVRLTGMGSNPDGLTDIWTATFPTTIATDAEPFDGTLFVKTTAIPSLKFSETYKDALVNIAKAPAPAEWELAVTYKGSLTASLPIEGIDLTTINASTPVELAIGAFAFSSTLGDDPTYTPAKKTATLKLAENAGTVKVTWDARRLTITVTLSVIDKPAVPSAPFFSHTTTPAIAAPYYFFATGSTSGLIDSRVRFADRAGKRAVFLNATYSTKSETKGAGTYRLSTISTTGLTDYTVPSLSFVAPANKAVVLGKKVPVVVGVSDNTALQKVEIKLNGGSAISASKKTLLNKVNGWVAEVTPIVGKNIVTAQAFDTSGNVSAIITREFTYVAKQGAYNSLLTDGGEFGRGTFYLTTTDAGGFSGKVILDGKTIPFKGNFSVGGHAVISIPFGGGNVTLTLDLVVNGDSTSVVGTLTGGVINVAFNAGRSVFDGKSTLAPQTGNYTMILPPENNDPTLPRGFGYATVTVATNGVTKIVGKLPDGSNLSYSGTIDGKNELPVFATLAYTAKGSLVGLLTFVDVPTVSDFSGDLKWTKPVQTTGFYKTGLSTTLPALGSKVSTLNIATYGGNADPDAYVPGTGDLIFADGNLASPVVAPVQVDKNLLFDGPPPNSATLKMTVLAGYESQFFTGTFKDGLKVRTYYGAVFGKQQIAVGFFLGNDQSGSVNLEPNP